MRFRRTAVRLKPLPELRKLVPAYGDLASTQRQFTARSAVWAGALRRPLAGTPCNNWDCPNSCSRAPSGRPQKWDAPAGSSMFDPEQYQLLDFGDGRRLERFGPLRCGPALPWPKRLSAGWRRQLWLAARCPLRSRRGRARPMGPSRPASGYPAAGQAGRSPVVRLSSK